MQNTKFSYFGLHLKKAIFKPKTFTFWKRLSLSQAEISRKNKKILYLVFCRQKKHFRSYNLKKMGPDMLRLCLYAHAVPGPYPQLEIQDIGFVVIIGWVPAS